MLSYLTLSVCYVGAYYITSERFGDAAVATHMIMRQGIPFGPELTEDEVKKNKTELVRGLAFTCYQSNLANGFEFVQESESIVFTLFHLLMTYDSGWANNTGFPLQKTVTPGFDPISKLAINSMWPTHL